MGRKNRDLFEILGERRGGKKRSRQVATPFEVLRGGVDWVRNLFAAGTARRGAKRIRGRPTKAAVSLGPAVLAALLVGALGLGFMLGRWSSGDGDPAELRRTDAAVGRQPEQPEWVQPDRISLTPEEEVETLSKFGYIVLVYPAAEREAAGVAAEWLRRRTFTRTRLRPMSNKGAACFAVICYVDSEADVAVEQDLIKLKRSPQWPKLPPGAVSFGSRPHLMQFNS